MPPSRASSVSSPWNRRVDCRVLLLLAVVVLLPLFVGAAPRQQARAAPTAAAAYLGDYSPNTRVEMRGDVVWFVRPPYESPLVLNEDGIYTFTQGWLAGKLAKFVHNDEGGVSIMLRADDGTWNEFARSGEVYNDVDPLLRERLTAVLEHQVASRDLPGAVLSVYIPGQGLWIGARGVADRGRGIPAVPHDRWKIASVSKVFLATVVLQLIDEGVLTLDDTVEHWLPGLVPNGQNITLRHLLNHTSGLYNYMNGPFINWVMADRQRSWSPTELVHYSNQYAPYFAPGEPGRWHYSNTNYVILGMAVESATGQSLARTIRQRILNPLEMWNTYFEPDEVVAGAMRGYLGREDVSDVSFAFAWGCGSMVSNADDLNRFGQALFYGELLSPERMQDMYTFVSVAGAWDTYHLRYGLGMMQDFMSVAPDDIHGNARSDIAGMVHGHTGALVGYRSALWYMPNHGVVIAVGINQMYTDANYIATAAMDAILTYQEETGNVSYPPSSESTAEVPRCTPDTTTQPCQ